MIKKYSNVLGLPVISAKDGVKIGTLKDVAFCRDNMGVAGFILEKDSHNLKGNVVLLEDVLSLGNDALIVDDADRLLKYRKFRKFPEMKERMQLQGFKIYTHSGNDIGIVQDILFDYRTGKVEGVQVSDGLVQDLMMGRNILPFIGRIEIGSDNILVENEAVEEMMNTGGGLRSRLN
ncbi:uncharacterized protein YrrD [Ruminiclostridium sufflavum DSM 19573]|uniref:Uncharacterized protein YrrD n=1 Tax=Ruminiclostridium sufflavum DSM 19573 TaxID=1121337 RepID=A0A318XL80_9FIRM|nr:uncharacterized protein YrrD [Ruminiclostridium sufflavum DSM 19573]